VMERGTIAQQGSPAEVWTHPATAAVARLLGLSAVVDVVATDGEVAAPWGPLGRLAGVADGPAQVVVRPDAVVVDPDPGADGIEGRVVSRTFRGDRTIVRVALGATGASVDAAVDPALAPADGVPVRVRIDPAGVTVLGTAAAPPDPASRLVPELPPDPVA